MHGSRACLSQHQKHPPLCPRVLRGLWPVTSQGLSFKSHSLAHPRSPGFSSLCCPAPVAKRLSICANFPSSNTPYMPPKTSLLQSHIDRLHKTDHPAVQGSACAAVFDQLGQHNAFSSKAGSAAMLQCLAHGSPAVTQAAVQGMCHLVSQAGMDAGQATDMLLASLASPGSEACVLALVDGIADLAQEQALQGTVAFQCLGL